MQFVPGTPLAGGAGCSTADDTFCFGQSVLAVRSAKACRLGSCILPAGLADGRTGRNILEGSASLPGRVFFAGIAGVFAAAALGGLADACPRMGCPGAGVVVVCGGGKRGVSAGAVPADALGRAVCAGCAAEHGIHRSGLCGILCGTDALRPGGEAWCLPAHSHSPCTNGGNAWHGTGVRPDIPGAGIAACMEHRDIFPAGRGAAAGLADLRNFSHRGAVRMLGQEYAIQKRKEVRQ